MVLRALKRFVFTARQKPLDGFKFQGVQRITLVQVAVVEIENDEVLNTFEGRIQRICWTER